MKRQRGRGRKPGGGHHHHHGGNNQNPNRAMESNGPEGGKVRGPAAVIYERYLQLARDAASSGDRVLSENYLQHADHYFRLVRSMQPVAPPQQPHQDRFSGDTEYESEEDNLGESEGADDTDAVAGAEGEPADAEFTQTQQPQSDRDGEPRRRRGRRNRFRPAGNEGEGGDLRNEGEAEREPRELRETRDERRRERPQRDEQRDDSGPEGFSNSPRPAFLRSD